MAKLKESLYFKVQIREWDPEGTNHPRIVILADNRLVIEVALHNCRCLDCRNLVRSYSYQMAHTEHSWANGFLVLPYPARRRRTEESICDFLREQLLLDEIEIY